ncbi:hypothetical protein BO99DRAFT_102429 [Aspergillus violaceofuscus CBS 115571]|uniref:DUF7730 domain-containing protein n=1 Tax=Aspergillus violaceofuscus (strain CBS 115571) TaxID=1450538 RepID=A0A2V5H904_ASPV1|nr:hypothetical protein BO99DRAFT_102429 [Aspergillus violaceofuscus CBS 115571]
MDSPRPKPTLLTLPLELRQIIYTYLFTTQPITIQREPIPSLTTNPPNKTKTPLPSPDNPSPTTPNKPHNQPSYALLLTNRQLHHETQHLAYSAPLFHTEEPEAFANFTSGLTRPQIQTIRHLSFFLPQSQGMETHAAEWHETFAFVSLACPHLRSVSVAMALAFPSASGKDTYWDGGLLELDRVTGLRGMRVVIYRQEEGGKNDLFFGYTAGRLHPAVSDLQMDTAAVGAGAGAGSESTADRPISFHHARDTLRRALSLPDSNSGRLFFRTSPNVFPLYVRNLTEMLLRRRRSHAEIRGEDRMQRSELYHYGYLNGRAFEGDRVFGFQYSTSGRPKEWEFERALEGVRLARERLRVRREKGRLGACARPARMALRGRGALRRFHKEGTVVGVEVAAERPGAWRRQLLLEASAPLIESFPDCVARPYHSKGRGSGCLRETI